MLPPGIAMVAFWNTAARQCTTDNTLRKARNKEMSPVQEVDGGDNRSIKYPLTRSNLPSIMNKSLCSINTEIYSRKAGKTRYIKASDFFSHFHSQPIDSLYPFVHVTSLLSLTPARAVQFSIPRRALHQMTRFRRKMREGRKTM